MNAPELSDAVLAPLQALLGPRLLSDAASRAFYANDIFWQPGVMPTAIALPETVQEAAAVVRTASELGLAVVPRGGGMSYSKGYLADRPGWIVVDMRRLDRVVEVNADDLYVVVEAGCTWAKLHEALQGSGLRTGYWGPLSGINATIGGALSQQSAFFGSGRFGVVADSVIGLEVILADGRVVATGSGGRTAAKPFTRYSGPDLTGLFLGDTGALGLKARAVLRLRPEAAATGFLSFGFASMAAMVEAQVGLGRTGLIAETFGIDRAKAEHSASVNRVSDNLKALANVARASGGLLKGVREAAAVAGAGTGFLKEHAFTLHMTVETDNDAGLAGSLDRLRRIAAAAGAKEIEPSVPKVMRARPFGPVRGMLGLDGQRWVPIHAVFPLGDAQKVVAANEAYFAERADFVKRHGVLVSVMTMTVGSEFFLEPAFYWYDEITPLHAASLGEAVVKPWLDRPADEGARAAVVELRAGCQQLYAGLGGVSWQIARDYPFRTVLKPETWALLTALKQALDPRGLMNPGALGLGGPAPAMQ